MLSSFVMLSLCLLLEVPVILRSNRDLWDERNDVDTVLSRNNEITRGVEATPSLISSIASTGRSYSTSSSSR